MVPTDGPELKELKKKHKSSTPKKAASKVKAYLKPIPSQPETKAGETEAASPKQTPSVYISPEPEIIAVEKEVVLPVEVSSTPVPSPPETVTAEIKEASPKQAPSLSVPLQSEVIPVEKKVGPSLRVSSTDIPLKREAKTVVTKVVPLARTSSTFVPLQQEAKSVETKTATPIQASSTPEVNEEQPIIAEQEVYEEVLIGKQKVKMSIPDNVLRQAKLANSESKKKLAGYWSAQVIKENPHVMHSPLIDPVSIWFEIKSVILNKFNGTSY